MNFSFRLAITIGLTATVLFGSSGSSHAKDSKPAAPPLFFPSAPDDPRIQFLASFSTEEELAALGGKRSFFHFIVGKETVQHPIIKPYGISSLSGRFFVCDTIGASVEVVDLAKHKIRYFQPSSEGALGLPVNIAVDTDGTRYITDTNRGRVLVFKEDTYAGAIGSKGEMKPVGIALAKDRIYVTDVQNHCVRVYDKAGFKPLFTFPKQGETNKAAQLYSPTNLAVDKAGRISVADTGAFVVNSYDSSGKYLKTIGTQGLEPGKFALPKGIAVDRDGHIYVVDAATQVVQLFDSEGRLLMYFGNPSSTAGGSTSLPAGIAIDYDNLKYFQRFVAPNFEVEYLVLLTNQTGGHKISVFGFGHKK